MPELPEVQTVVSDLQQMVSGQSLKRIDIYDPKVWFESTLDPDDFQNRQLQQVTRRGKYIVYDFDDQYLVQHLRMTGKMLPADSDKIPHNIEIGKNPQVRLSLFFAELELVFWDQRRFGTFTAITDLNQFFTAKELAPEIFSENGHQRALEHYLKKTNRTSRSIKTALLDQSIICGPGNIYADEALHRVGIHPQAVTNQLSQQQHHQLFKATKKVMQAAIAKRGTSASDYLDVNGNPGVFKQYLRVYRRTGEPCKTCQSATIQKLKVSGRSSHYCPNCQPNA